MEFSHFAVLLLLLSVAILFAEVFIPSGGVLGMMSAASLAGSIFCAWRAWANESPSYFWVFLGVVAVTVPASFVAAFWIFPKTPIGKQVLLDAPDPDAVAPFAEEQQQFEDLIGATGTTLSMLGPGGLVSVNGERVHAESPGMLIESGETVHVVAVRGNRIVVKPGAGPAPPLGEDDVADDDSATTDRDDLPGTEGGDPADEIDDLPFTDAEIAAETEPTSEEPPLDFPLSQG